MLGNNVICEDIIAAISSDITNPGTEGRKLTDLWISRLVISNKSINCCFLNYSVSLLPLMVLLVMLLVRFCRPWTTSWCLLPFEGVTSFFVQLFANGCSVPIRL
ncbi:Uncharacterized protein TCM_016297 [Theobroma cacao]|uniref:Uncharacterized protein n=1 Tax=Theobroma cacao TaxID=3641 RepID=A0A061G5F2_THECC|nr:Uncharacterized protein TCM_016297 [Theobroma cacao]